MEATLPSALTDEEIRYQKLRVKRARAKTYAHETADEAFLSHLCKIPDLYDDSLPLAATNGRWIGWNLQAVQGLSDKEVYGVLLHELLHIGLLHIVTIKNLPDKKRANIAADLAINSLLTSIRNASLPAGGCFVGESPFEDFPANETMDHYYQLLLDMSDEKLAGFQVPQDVIQLTGDGDADGEEGSGVSTGLLEEQVKAAVRNALEETRRNCRSRGEMSASLVKHIEAAVTPKIDYRRVLRKYHTKLKRGGADWTRPNRRLRAVGVNAARNRKRAIGNIICLLDVSGSMSDEVISQCLTEIRTIFAVSGATVHVWQHDTQIVSKDTFEKVTPQLTRNACGGTSHIQPFEEIQVSTLNPDLVICLSDMYTQYPESWTRCPVVWVATEHVPAECTPPFGRVCHFDE